MNYLTLKCLSKHFKRTLPQKKRKHYLNGKQLNTSTKVTIKKQTLCALRAAYWANNTSVLSNVRIAGQIFLHWESSDIAANCYIWLRYPHVGVLLVARNCATSNRSHKSFVVLPISAKKYKKQKICYCFSKNFLSCSHQLQLQVNETFKSDSGCNFCSLTFAS